MTPAERNTIETIITDYRSMLAQMGVVQSELQKGMDHLAELTRMVEQERAAVHQLIDAVNARLAELDDVEDEDDREPWQSDPDAWKSE